MELVTFKAYKQRRQASEPHTPYAELRLYAAYGANLNRKDMLRRAPNARVLGSGVIEDHRLYFNSVASIEPWPGAEVKVAVWLITPACERELDMYEGIEWGLYRKEMKTVIMDVGMKVNAMVYILNERRYPSDKYLEQIIQGYDDHGFGIKPLRRALDRCLEPPQRR